PDNDWQPMTQLTRALEAHRRCAVGIVVESEGSHWPVGATILEETSDSPGATYRSGAATPAGVAAALDEASRTGRTGWLGSASPRLRVFTLPLSLPPRLLLLGAGPDAAPVVDFAARLNWKVTLVDHRPAYADASHFPAAERVVQAAPDEIPLDLSHFSAAVVMSHHLPSDLKYLRTLSATNIPYIGLLRPAV